MTLAPTTNPDQKDLNALTFDPGPTAVGITWNWDDTGFGNLGGNTGDACTLVDTDADGFANYAFCIVADGNPASQISNRLYACTADSRTDRCAGPSEIPTFTSTSTASVVPNSDPFVGVGDHNDGNDCDAANCLTADTVANVTLQLSDVGGASAARVLNVCSFPSREPNSDPSDCVFAPNNGSLTIVKAAPSGDTSQFTINATVPSQGNVSSWNITGSGSVQLISYAPGTALDLSEAIPSGYSLSGASCVLQTQPTAATGTPTATGVDNITIQSRYRNDLYIYKHTFHRKTRT